MGTAGLGRTDAWSLLDDVESGRIRGGRTNRLGISAVGSGIVFFLKNPPNFALPDKEDERFSFDRSPCGLSEA